MLYKHEYVPWLSKIIVFVVNPVGWPKGWPGWPTGAGWSIKWVNLFDQPIKRSTLSVNLFGQPKIKAEWKKMNWKKKVEGRPSKTQKSLFFCVFLLTFLPKIFEIKLNLKFSLISKIYNVYFDKNSTYLQKY